MDVVPVELGGEVQVVDLVPALSLEWIPSRLQPLLPVVPPWSTLAGLVGLVVGVIREFGINWLVLLLAGLHAVHERCVLEAYGCVTMKILVPALCWCYEVGMLVCDLPRVFGGMSRYSVLWNELALWSSRVLPALTCPGTV